MDRARKKEIQSIVANTPASEMHGKLHDRQEKNYALECVFEQKEISIEKIRALADCGADLQSLPPGIQRGIIANQRTDIFRCFNVHVNSFVFGVNAFDFHQNAFRQKLVDEEFKALRDEITELRQIIETLRPKNADIAAETAPAPSANSGKLNLG